jgi:hypothetical protein
VSPDPDAAEWRQVAADLGALAQEHVARVFAWIDDELANSGSDGAVSLMLALSDLDRGMPLHAVIDELAIWYERDLATGYRVVARPAERSGAR